MSDESSILVLHAAIAPRDLARLVSAHFEDMVKYVADLRRGVIAIGGEMHADAEAVLLADGSSQIDLWGANYYPGRGPEECIEFTSLINIRPAEGNRSMEIQSSELRERVQRLTWALIGRGEALGS